MADSGLRVKGLGSFVVVCRVEGCPLRRCVVLGGWCFDFTFLGG